jgi:hypothetical protein
VQGTDCRHDPAQKDQQDFAKNNQEKICLLGHKKNWQNNSSLKNFYKNKAKKITI